MTEPVHVLVKVHADGYVEVYGPRHVRARIVYVPVCQSRLQERLMEFQIDRDLPQPYHFGGGELRQNGYVRGLGVAYDEYQEQLGLVALDRELVQCLKSMATTGSYSTPPASVVTPSLPSIPGPVPNTSSK